MSANATSGIDLERTQAVLSAAVQQLAPHAGEGELRRIVDRVLGSLAPEQLRAPNVGALTALVDSELKAGTTSIRPRNDLSATPAEIEAARLAGGASVTAARLGLAQRGASGKSGASSDGDSRSSERGYGSISYASAGTLQGITSANFTNSAFAQAGLSYETFRFLRGADPGLTTQNLLQAANDARLLGFTPKDRDMMKSLSIIDRYDNKPRETVDALRRHGHIEDKDKDELKELLRRRQAAKTAEARKESDEAIKDFWSARREKSGVKARISDPQSHPKARTETERAAKKIEKKVEDAVRHAPKTHHQLNSEWGDPAGGQTAKQAAIFNELRAKRGAPKP
jgi:hypothetical protein